MRTNFSNKSKSTPFTNKVSVCNELCFLIDNSISKNDGQNWPLLNRKAASQPQYLVKVIEKAVERFLAIANIVRGFIEKTSFVFLAVKEDLVKKPYLFSFVKKTSYLHDNSWSTILPINPFLLLFTHE